MEILKIGLAQIAPVWMNRQKTLEKAAKYAKDAANQNFRKRARNIIKWRNVTRCARRRMDY